LRTSTQRELRTTGRIVVEPLVADANPMISAMLGGVAREVIFSGSFTLYSPQHTLFEVEKYIPAMAKKLGRPELDLLREFELLPIVACQPNMYDSHVAEAISLISQRDPKDVQILALTLTLGFPLWTEDNDFDGIEVISVRRTADLVRRITM
jgi:predicted nucleic acid-binding protein